MNLPSSPLLFGPHRCPGNVSRTHLTEQDASTCPEGVVAFEVDEGAGFVKNPFFDSNLVRYDGAYSTTVCASGSIQSQSARTVGTIMMRFGLSGLLDVGCGRGEFVHEMRKMGCNARGVDPVLDVESPYLTKGFWAPGTQTAQLYSFRCVLPHMTDPFTVLDEIWDLEPDALVYVEYQRLEWMAEFKVWYQLCHDHVVQLRVSDFDKRCIVVDLGEFGEGEWQWVLLAKKTAEINVSRSTSEDEIESSVIFADLERNRASMLALFSSSVQEQDLKNLVVWGAAGKGSTLAHALKVGDGTFKLFVVDQEPTKHGRFLESSGLRVSSPEVLDNLSSIDTAVLVANPRHVPAVRRSVDETMRVLSSLDF